MCWGYLQVVKLGRQPQDRCWRGSSDPLDWCQRCLPWNREGGIAAYTMAQSRTWFFENYVVACLRRRVVEMIGVMFNVSTSLTIIAHDSCVIAKKWSGYCKWMLWQACLACFSKFIKIQCAHVQKAEWQFWETIIGTFWTVFDLVTST